jgi:hypothetical protein
VQITKWLPENLDNLLFCHSVIDAISHNKLREPRMYYKHNSRGEPVCCVIDDSVMVRNCNVVYKATGESLMPQY